MMAPTLFMLRHLSCFAYSLVYWGSNNAFILLQLFDTPVVVLMLVSVLYSPHVCADSIIRGFKYCHLGRYIVGYTVGNFV